MADVDLTSEERKALENGLATLRTRLLDLSRRNRLLNYRETRWDIPLDVEDTAQLFRRLIEDEQSLEFAPASQQTEEAEEQPLEGEDEDVGASEAGDLSDPFLSMLTAASEAFLQTPLREKDLEQKLRKLYLEHRSIIEETGANSLYLAAGFLHWTESGEEGTVPSRSPLVLLPVRLKRERRAGEATYLLQFDDEPLQANYSLKEKLWSSFNITLPEPEDELEPEQYWSEVEEAILAVQREGWSVSPDLVLGLFSFSKQVMWHDLDSENWPKKQPLLGKSLIQRVLLGTGPSDTPARMLEPEYGQDKRDGTPLHDIRLVLDADSSQYSAIVDALEREEGLVIEGPPGTGKSQTIANLIAVAIQKGMSVLFLAEKMAALEVVYRRLEELELGDFCLQLHGLKTNKRETLQAVEKRVRRVKTGTDGLEHKEMRLRNIKKQLLSASEALSKATGPERMPLHRVVWRMERLRADLPDGWQALEVERASGLGFEAFDAAKGLLYRLALDWEEIGSTARVAWQGFVPQQYADSRKAEVVGSCMAAIEAVEAVETWFESQGIDPADAPVRTVGAFTSLGTLNPDSAFPPIPDGGDPVILARALKGRKVESLGSLASLLNEYIPLTRSVSRVFDYAADNVKEFADKASYHASRLKARVCAPEVSLSQLPRERDLHAEVRECLGGFPRQTEPLREWLDLPVRTLADVERLCASAQELLAGPKSLVRYACPQHCLSRVGFFLEEAQRRNAKLKEEREALSSLFRLDAIQETEVFAGAVNTVSLHAADWFPFFNREYRAARLEVRRLLVSPASFSREGDFIRHLEAAVSYCRARDAFRQDEELLENLGGAFKGLDTDWADLLRLVEFSRRLREQIGVDKARALLSDWNGHEETLQEVLTATRRSWEKVSDFAAKHPYANALWARPIPEVMDTLNESCDDLARAVEALDPNTYSSGVSLVELMDSTKAFTRARELERKLEEHPDFEELLSPIWGGALTNPDFLSSIEDWVHSRLSSPGVSVELLGWLVEDDGQFKTGLATELLRVARTFASTASAHNKLLNEFGYLRWKEWCRPGKGSLGDWSTKLTACIDTVDSLPTLQRWYELHRQASAGGLGGFSDGVIEGGLSSANVRQAFEVSVYAAVASPRFSVQSL